MMPPDRIVETDGVGVALMAVKCAWCGANKGEQAVLWQECDHNDQPEAKYLFLCQPCSDQLIEPHVRLYSQINKWAPAAGAMRLCLDCRHRTGTTCKSPKALFNGGTQGLAIDTGPVTQAFVDGVRNGRRTGWREVFYSGPPKSCAGWQAIEFQPTLDGEIEL